MVDNHITVYPSNYRGRQVTESNVQDYISNIVSKYFPVGLPPWQICVIPVIGTVSSASAENTATEASTSAESASAINMDEDQQTASDTTAVRHYTKCLFLSGLKFVHSEGHVSFDTFTRSFPLSHTRYITFVSLLITTYVLFLSLHFTP